MLYLRFIKRKVPQVMVFNIGRNPLGTFVFELKKIVRMLRFTNCIVPET